MKLIGIVVGLLLFVVCCLEFDFCCLEFDFCCLEFVVWDLLFIEAGISCKNCIIGKNANNLRMERGYFDKLSSSDAD